MLGRCPSGHRSVLKAFIDSFLGNVPPERRDHTRFLTGRYNIAVRKRLHNNEREFFACRADRISPQRVALIAPVIGGIGNPVVVQFDELGELKGRISRHMDRGFEVDIKGTIEEGRRLAIKLSWLRTRKEAQDAHNRKRSMPREPLSTLVLADGNTPRCFVIDMSVFGASVSAEIVPEIGAPIAVGTIIGRVTRHLREGFAIRFLEQQSADQLESRLIKPDWRRESSPDVAT
jgi:hypothetical protein